MLILKAIILGAVQGISEFFPVSSSGHLSLLGNLLGMEIDPMFNIMLHLGTLLAVFLYFYKEIVRCIRELAGIFRDLYHNFRQFAGYRGGPEGPVYVRVLSNTWRKIDCMLLLSMIPTAVLAFIIRPFAEMLNRNLLCSGLGLFITALLLFAASFTERSAKGPKEAKYSDALLVGVFQGFASFPGVSRFGMTLSSGFFSGFSSRFNRVYAFLLFIPTIAGAVILEGSRQPWTGNTVGILPCLCGMFAAFAFGLFTIRIAVRIITSVSLKGFAGYCACIGLLSIILYLI